jgi:hypothetical protein
VPGEDWFQRIRTYHGLYSAEHNEVILDNMMNDDECQVIIATMAFANGHNIKTILDNISLGVYELGSRIGSSGDVQVNQICLTAQRINQPNIHSRYIIIFPIG